MSSLGWEEASRNTLGVGSAGGLPWVDGIGPIWRNIRGLAGERSCMGNVLSD